MTTDAIRLAEGESGLIDGLFHRSNEVTPEQRIDAALDSVLKASGSALKHYMMPKTLADMREAMRKVMSDACIKGSNDTIEPIKKAGHNAEKTMTKWISAKRRLPKEEDGTVAVLCDDGSILTAWATYWHGASNAFAQWTFPHQGDDDRTVTHWYPLPQVPNV